MGLIKAIVGAAGGVAADQWKEYFYCDALSADVLAKKGQKRSSNRSSNTKGSDNIITTGSVIAVADGQCMMIVEQGKVVEIAAEPGEFVFDSSTEPTVFAGNFGESLMEVFKNIGKRFTFGGEPPKDQRVYYFNTKEIIGNKYGTPNSVPFRVVDQRVGIDMDINVRCFGEYSYHISNPILFYTNVCGNVEEEYTRENIDSQMKSELLTALQPAFARISGMGIRYSALPGHTTELAAAINDEMSAKWRDLRGIEVVSMGVSSIKAEEEDEKMLKGIQAYSNPTAAAAGVAYAQMDAMRAAAANEGGGGAAMAFMGAGMAGMAGQNATNMFQMGQQMGGQMPPQDPNMGYAQGGGFPAGGAGYAQGGGFPQQGMPPQGGGFPQQGMPPQGAQPGQGAAAPAEGQWFCPKCGAKNNGNFCTQCGTKKPEGF